MTDRWTDAIWKNTVAVTHPYYEGKSSYDVARLIYPHHSSPQPPPPPPSGLGEDSVTDRQLEGGVHNIAIIFWDNKCSINLVCYICMLYFKSFYLKLLLSQTNNSCPLKFEIKRADSIFFFFFFFHKIGLGIP